MKGMKNEFELFKELFKLFYYFGKDDEIAIVEGLGNIIGSFLFAFFFYILLFIDKIIRDWVSPKSAATGYSTL